MAKSFRGIDNYIELQISNFMDKNFYPKHTTNFTRASDYETQMNGVDIQFSFMDLKNILVDEKAAAHYINSNLPTFAFELTFLVYDKVVTGWLFDENKKTQYYLLQWLTAKKDKNISCEDILSIDCLLIERNKIIELLKTYGLNKEKAMTTAFEIRNRNIVGVSERDNAKPFYFYFSTQLMEQPINIIIKKRKLIEIAHSRFLVTPQS